MIWIPPRIKSIDQYAIVAMGTIIILVAAIMLRISDIVRRYARLITRDYSGD